MNSAHQKRRQLSINTEFLESRQLLNAHVPHQPSVQISLPAHAIQAPHESSVHAASASKQAIHQISGTLTGQGLYTEDTVNLDLGTDAYVVQGKTNQGIVSLTAQDSVDSPAITRTTFQDTYSGGSATLTLKNGSTIGITYHGSGSSSALVPQYTATFKGQAIGTSGSQLGHKFSFTATVAGNQANADVSFKITLKG
jgi:hypothetical protein